MSQEQVSLHEFSDGVKKLTKEFREKERKKRGLGTPQKSNK